MKRLLAAALILACAVGLTSQASAQTGFAWVPEKGKFFNSQDTYGGKTVVDSTQATGNAARRDTTISYRTDRWTVPLSVGSATIDSLPFFRVDIFPVAYPVTPGSGTNISTAADSIYFTVQVSVDNTNWLTPATYHLAFQAANTVNASEIGAFLLEQGTTNTFSVGFHQVKTNNAFSSANVFGQGGATAPTDKQLWGYPYMRFILGWGGTGTGAYGFNVWHLEPLAYDPEYARQHDNR